MSEEYTNGQTMATESANPEEDYLGFNRKTENPRKYFEIFDGSLCVKSKEPREGYEGPIKTINPRDKSDVFTYVLRFDNIVAYIIDINKHSHKFDNGGSQSSLELTLKAGANIAILRLPWIKSPLKRFLKVSRNINFRKPLYISVFPTDGGQGIGINFKQGEGGNFDNWTKVEEAYKRGDGIMPEGIENTFSGEWNFDAQNDFLLRAFIKDVLPTIKQIAKENGIVPRPEQSQAQQQQAQQQPAPTAADLAEARRIWELQQAEHARVQAQQNVPHTQQGQVGQYPTQPLNPPPVQQGFTPPPVQQGQQAMPTNTWQQGTPTVQDPAANFGQVQQSAPITQDSGIDDIPF